MMVLKVTRYAEPKWICAGSWNRKKTRLPNCSRVSKLAGQT